MTDTPRRAREELARTLLRLRDRSGLGGRDAAARAGADQSSISRIETGIIRPSHELLERLLDLYLPDARHQEERVRIETLWELSWMDPDSRHVPALLGLEHTRGERLSLRAGAQAAREAAELLDQAANGDALKLRQVEERLALAHAAIHATRADRYHQNTTE